MANLTDADKVLRNDTGKDIVTKLNAIKIAIENSGGGGSSTFEGLTDVDIDDQTLTNGQVPKYNSTTQKWENGDVSLVGDLDDLSDVDTTGKADGDSLRYDGNEWVAKPTTVGMTQDEWNAIADKVAWRNAHKNTHLVITDAPNLNAKADDIEYSSGVTVADKLDTIPTRTDFIRYEDKTIGAVEFTNAYYLLPSGSRPTVPSGYMFLMGVLLDYGSIQSGTSAVITIDQNGAYLFGIAGSKYSNVKVRYIYIKS